MEKDVFALHRSRLCVDAGALEHNMREIAKHRHGHARIAAVVKSNAYGHGMPIAWRAFHRGGADLFCVDSLHEGVELREDGCPLDIFVMGHIPAKDAPYVTKISAKAMAYDVDFIDALNASCRAAGRIGEIFLKVETGTHRQGVSGREALALANHVSQSCDHVRVEGLCSHFANVEDTTNHAYARRQLEKFDDIYRAFRAEGFEVKRSIANSAATLLWPETQYDICRPGITCYGMWPSNETCLSAKLLGKSMDLRPALTWITRVAQVKEVDADEAVGYGCTYRTTHRSRIAVLPVGYYDGYVRALSNRAHVLIRGRRAPIRGRICMNMCMADVTDIEGVGTGDEVVLLGGCGEEAISAELLAEWAGTINYELTTQIQTAIPRTEL